MAGLEADMNVVKELFQLQQIDSQREAQQQRLAEVEAGLGESQDVARAREAVTETETKLDRLRTRLRDLELEIEGLNSKLRTNQDRLYSGRVRNPKELSNLQEEAAALRRRRSELEDQQLELLIGIEEEEAELSERQARLSQIEAMWRDEQASLTKEKAELEQDIQELDQERAARRGRLGATDLALYDDLRSSLGGVAVVRLKRGICQACGVDVPTHVARSVEHGEGLQYCPTCSRLLYGG
jgi:predicted  nucleic acid-binding Zn-ribbon protein